MVRKYITIDIKNISEYNDLVCKYIFKKGINLGSRCYVRNHCDGYCLKHFKLVQKYEINQNTSRCKYKTINGYCNRKCINKNICKYHKSTNKEEIENFSLKTKYNNEYKLICYYNDYKDKKKINNLIIKDDIYTKYNNTQLLICYNNENSLFKSYLSKLKKKLKKKKYKENKKNKNKTIENTVENMNFSDIFDEAKEIRNYNIIKYELNILVLTDKKFIKQMFDWCISIFSKKTESDKAFDNLITVAMDYDIIPCNENDPDYNSISFQDYKNKIKKLSLEIYKEDIIYIKKYIEFIFKSYHLAYYRTENMTKEIENEMENITNGLIEKIKL